MSNHADSRNRRRPHNPRRTFSVREQLEGKRGQNGIAELILALDTIIERKRKRRRR